MSDFIDFGYVLQSTDPLDPEDFMTIEEMAEEMAEEVADVLDDEVLNRIADERSDGPFIPVEIEDLMDTIEEENNSG